VDNLEKKHEPCPHCGGHPEMIHGMQDGWVACTKCVATGPRRSSDDDAWAAWDRRAGAQCDRALEAVEKLREAVIDASRFLNQRVYKTAGERYTIGKLEEALAATKPATVELPKCDECDIRFCSPDCDGSSHYTPDVKP